MGELEKRIDKESYIPRLAYRAETRNYLVIPTRELKIIIEKMRNDRSKPLVLQDICGLSQNQLVNKLLDHIKNLEEWFEKWLRKEERE